MSSEEQHIFKLLQNATLKECLALFEGTSDNAIKDSLRPLLFDEQSGAVQMVQTAILQDELVKLAHKNADFRRYVTEWWQTTLDRVSATYLKELMESA